MKSDVLERLLIDRAAGELSPDVAELLEDHLQHEPAARRAAGEIAETFRLARVALVKEKVIPLPTRRPPLQVPMWAWAMAACFVCGLSLGIFAPRGGSVNPSIASSAPPPRTVVAAAPDDTGFWSVRRIRAAVPVAARRPENSIIWKSPVQKPQIL
jgi:anti-sigma factor RsiW